MPLGRAEAVAPERPVKGPPPMCWQEKLLESLRGRGMHGAGTDSSCPRRGDMPAPQEAPRRHLPETAGDSSVGVGAAMAGQLVSGRGRQGQYCGKVGTVLKLQPTLSRGDVQDRE